MTFLSLPDWSIRGSGRCKLENPSENKQKSSSFRKKSFSGSAIFCFTVASTKDELRKISRSPEIEFVVSDIDDKSTFICQQNKTASEFRNFCQFRRKSSRNRADRRKRERFRSLGRSLKTLLSKKMKFSKEGGPPSTEVAFALLT